MNFTAGETIDDLRAPAGGSDFNLVQLVERLDEGARVGSASVLPQGLPPWPGPCLLLVLEREGEDAEVLPVGLGRSVVELLRNRASGLPLGGARASAAPEQDEVESGAELAETLRSLIEQTSGEPPDERAAVLMDWVMERLDATRCALLPVEAGVPGAPLVFHHRGRPHGSGSAHQVPRHVVRHVARTRESLVAHDVGDASNVLPASESVVAQRVQSYMALPVTFRGRLISVAYLDRLDRPRRFRSGDLALFELFAYELARPLLELLHEQERREFDELRDFLATSGGRTRSVPVSEALQPTLERARKVARFADESLLILGETGAGKEWLARFVHELSGRRGAFVPVNVSALSAELFAADLMGSVRGAFTGAVDRAGRIEEAEAGTLFLDEIGDLDPANQVKLLRFLQDGRVRRVGGKEERDADVRVIAATNVPRCRLRDQGHLREDLLQRFGPPLEVPPLRQRREEILALAENWISAKCRQRGVKHPALDAAAQRFLRQHAWPGNVRQLQLVLSHALALCSGDTLTAELLESLVEERPSAALGGPVPSWTDYQQERSARERAWLEAALDAASGKIEVAARDVGCPASTFRDLMRRNGVRRG